MKNVVKKDYPLSSHTKKKLSQKAAKGGVWVLSLKIFQQLFGFTKLIILARFLSPSDFGLMGIALLTMATVETFSETGFRASLIQKKEDITLYLDTAWTVSILRGVCLFLIILLIAPYVTFFFKAPQAKLVIQIIGITTLFQAFTNIAIVFYQKELEFHKQFFYQFSGTIADFIISISAVFILRNIWAIVIGFVSGHVIRCFASYWLHPYRPNINFDLSKIKELFRFGKWVLGSNILIFLIMQGDDILVGKLLGVSSLGYYQMAYRISNMPATEISHVISQVSFPIYAKLQTDILRLKSAYYEIFQFTTFIACPISGLILALSPDFTKLFLGEAWMPMLPALQLLSIFGLTRALASTTGSLFQGSGHPHILTILSVLQSVILTAIIYPLTIAYGIIGTSYAVVISNLITQTVTLFTTSKLLKGNSMYILNIFAIPSFATVGMFFIIYFIQSFLMLSIPNLFFQLISGILFYFVILNIINRKFFLTIRGLLNNLKE